MADSSDQEEELLDKVYLYLTEKHYADGTTDNGKIIIRSGLNIEVASPEWTVN